MATATLPRSAQILAGAQRPTIAQIRLLRRVAIQDVEEHRKLAAALQDGLGGIKEDAKVRKAILCFALGHFSDAEEALAGNDPYCQALLGLIYQELGEHADAKTNFAAAAKSILEAKAEAVRALVAGHQLNTTDKPLANPPQ